MTSAESRTGRHIVGTLDRGADLLEALGAVCSQYGVRCGELRATGSLESVRLATYDQAARRWRPARELSGDLELLGLSGTISEQAGTLSLAARATLVRERDTGVEVVGGHLRGGRVFCVEYVIDSFDDVILRRGADADTGLDTWAEALPLAPAASPAPAPAPASTPSPVLSPEPTPMHTLPPAPAPASIPVPTSPGEEILIHPGDVLVHPKFGRCTVLRLEGDREFAHLRLRNSRVVRLSLDVVTLRAAGTEDGQRVFQASIV